MNTPLKIVLYVVLSVAAITFGQYFFRDYQRANDAAVKADSAGDPMDVEVPSYDLGATESDPPPQESLPSNQPGSESMTEPLSANGDDTSANRTGVAIAEGNPVRGSDASLPAPRLGFYGGGFMISLLCLGLLAAVDITQYLGRSAVDALYNDNLEGMTDDEYETAEAEWQNGDYLEAIRLMREYYAKNPKQVHAALRIAEIYEKDLNNPLAAALEYEEILNQKLPRERWGWAAIHLANIYSGSLEKPDQAVALLRRLDEEYGDTQAAEKARKRLAMIDGTGPAG